MSAELKLLVTALLLHCVAGQPGESTGIRLFGRLFGSSSEQPALDFDESPESPSTGIILGREPRMQRIFNAILGPLNLFKIYQVRIISVSRSSPKSIPELT